MTLFNPSPCPGFVRGKRVDMRANIAQFGDGYSQRSGDGLNAISRQINLSWPKLTAAQAQTIEDFFVSHAGYSAFEYPGTRDGIERKYIVRTFQRNELAEPGLDTMTATLEQVFDP